jgi:hypothetical protein
MYFTTRRTAPTMIVRKRRVLNRTVVDPDTVTFN